MTLLRYLPRFQKAYRELDTLAARERWSRAEIQTWQLERLNRVWARAIENVPYYRRLWERLRLPNRFSSLTEYSSLVPVVSRAEFKDNHREFVSCAPEPGGWHVTSGSTGTPTSFYWSRAGHLEALRCRYRMLADWGVNIFDRCAMFWGDGSRHTPGAAGMLARARRVVEDTLRRRLRMTAYHLGPADLRACLNRLDRFEPAMLYAYSTAAYLLAREAEAAGRRIDSLKLCCLSAEPALPHMIETIERAFGVPAVIEYGATECPLIAGEGRDRTIRVREDILFAETIPDHAGGQEILLTVLCNPSFPLLRYAIGDVTEAPLEIPECGFAVLKNVGGRKNEVLLTGAGRVLHPLRFDFLFGFDLADTVRRYRVHQNAAGAVAVTVETTRSVAPARIARLQHELDELLEGYPVTLEFTAELPNLPQKHRWTTSELAATTVAAR